MPRVSPPPSRAISSPATACGRPCRNAPRAKSSARSRRHKLELVRFSFADQHGVLRGKTLLASEVAGALRNGVTMTTTLLAKDTSHRTVFPVFTPGGGFAMEEMQGGADFVMIADPTTFRVLPWADKTGWLLCDIHFSNGKPVPFSTRARCREALDTLAAGRLRLLRRARSRIPSVQAGKPAPYAGRRHLAAAGAGGEPAHPGLSVSHRIALRHARSGAGDRPPRRRRARPAAALG